jgi:hypothetical protein
MGAWLSLTPRPQLAQLQNEREGKRLKAWVSFLVMWLISFSFCPSHNSLQLWVLECKESPGAEHGWEIPSHRCSLLKGLDSGTTRERDEANGVLVSVEVLMNATLNSQEVWSMPWFSSFRNKKGWAYTCCSFHLKVATWNPDLVCGDPKAELSPAFLMCSPDGSSAGLNLPT